LFHYTTAEGCFSIIDTSQLWASSAFCTNDKTEIEYGLRLAKRIAKKFLPRDEYDRIAPYVSSWFSNTCVVSFSAPPADRLSHWRAYGKDGAGYAIGFRTARLVETGEQAVPRFTLTRVIYDKKEQQKVLTGLFERERAACSLNPAAIISRALKLAALTFKDQGFSDESEWRLISANPFESITRTNGKGLQSELVTYRAAPWGIMPYIVIPFDRSLINEIWLGPGPDDRRERTLTMFIEHHKAIIAVQRSKVPFRSL
jgi:hypothetical protein